MRKDVIITTYFGNVEFIDFPKNFKKENMYTIVREALKVKTEKTQVELYNVKYYTNYGSDEGWYKLIKNDKDICPIDCIDCTIRYEDYLKGEGYIQVN